MKPERFTAAEFRDLEQPVQGTIVIASNTV